MTAASKKGANKPSLAEEGMIAALDEAFNEAFAREDHVLANLIHVEMIKLIYGVPNGILKIDDAIFMFPPKKS